MLAIGLLSFIVFDKVALLNDRLLPTVAFLALLDYDSTCH